MEDFGHDPCDENLFDSVEFEDDGQPSEYDEWQDFYGGDEDYGYDDCDHGDYDYV